MQGEPCMLQCPWRKSHCIAFQPSGDSSVAIFQMSIGSLHLIAGTITVNSISLWMLYEVIVPTEWPRFLDSMLSLHCFLQEVDKVPQLLRILRFGLPRS